MKTNQILKRKMGEYEVAQRTSDAMFNATDLLKQWNIENGMQKKLDHFFENKNTNEFINKIMEVENLDARNSVYVKSRASRGDKSGTWMHPLLFIDFAMWINPKFKYDVLKFVYDQLLEYRNNAGDSYPKLAESLKKIVGSKFLPVAIPNVAKACNHIVYGEHERNIRNTKAEVAYLKELDELQNKLCMLINEGFLNNYQQVMAYLRKQWQSKYQPKILTT